MAGKRVERKGAWTAGKLVAWKAVTMVEKMDETWVGLMVETRVV